MTVETLIDALRLPRESLVGKRVPKTLLLAQGAPTTADKRLLRDGIEEFTWLAAIKPTTGGPVAYRDDLRDYPEIAILHVSLRAQAKRDRLHALIHRAIPYPCLLLSSQGATLTLSLADKRRSQGDSTAWVTDFLELLDLHPAGETDAIREKFRAALALDARPVEDLHDLYQGWMDALLALRVARQTGVFRIHPGPAAAHARRAELDELAKLTRKLTVIRTQAAKEKQIARRVTLSETRQAIDTKIRLLLERLSA